MDNGKANQGKVAQYAWDVYSSSLCPEAILANYRKCILKVKW